MTIHRRTLLAFAATVALGAAGASAADKKPFSDAAFDAALKAGKPVLVEVTAPWCPTCRAQAPHISAVTGDAKFKNMVVLTVDFDSQKDVLKKLNVQRQSTLISYKGGKEAMRSTGDTDAGRIKSLIEAAL